MTSLFRSLRALVRLAALLAVSALLLPAALATRALASLGAQRRSLAGAAAVQALWARACLGCFGVRLDLPGRPPRGPFLVVANHVSYLDVLVLAHLFPGRFVAKSEIAGWPLFGWLSRSVGTLFLEKGRARDVLRVGEQIEATLLAGVGACVFPEGASSRGERVEPLRGALLEPAARRGFPCLAVSLGYTVPGDSVGAGWRVAWWGGMELPGHLWRLLQVSRVDARVRWSEEPRSAPDRRHLASLLHADLGSLFVPLGQGPPPSWVRGVGRSA